ncbi:MAG: cyclodeaminase/cyclohydrolase family protein [Thermaerobacter sp.]|nr:cyclodeaminase/cyclohydrolase family protein [Thermaerobacter sp.]
MDGFLDSLASATPTPGGGSAACYVAATGAAIVEMCAGLGAKKGKQGAEELAGAAHALRQDFLRQAELDGAAFDQVLSAYRMPKDSPERPDAIASALRSAALSPLHILDQVRELADLITRAQEITPAAAKSDWESAAVFARAASDVAGRNVRVNLDGAAGAAELEAQLASKLELVDRGLPKV